MLAVAGLLAACSSLTGGGGQAAPGSTEQASRFQSTGSCEPTSWQWLENAAVNLPPDKRQQVEMLIYRARDYRSDFDRGHCIMMLQQAERIVRE